MRARFRPFIAATAVAAAAVTAGFVAAAPAAAAPPPKDLPQLGLPTQSVFTFGDHDFCRGTLNYRFSSPKRSVVRITLTSSGFTGNGAGWRKDPVCRMTIGTAHISAIAYLKTTYFPAEFGARPGQKVVRDIVTGSGLVDIGVGTYTYRGRVPQGTSTASYLIVP